MDHRSLMSFVFTFAALIVTKVDAIAARMDCLAMIIIALTPDIKGHVGHAR